MTAARPQAAQIAGLVVTMFCASFSLFLLSATLPIYLYRDRGFSLEAVGELVGFAFVVQVVITLFAGPLIDRRGARLAIRLGPAFYAVAAGIFIATAAAPAIALARALQGIGAAMIIPAAFALLPTLVSERRRGTALGAFGATNTIALAIGPPVGLLLLRRGSLVLFGTALAIAALGFACSWVLGSSAPASRRGQLFTYRASWTPLLLVTFLTVVYWGVVTAFLPIHVPRVQLTNVGWFFTADALAVLAFRIPTGFLADRFGPRWLLAAGIVVTSAGILLLLAPASLLTLVLAGLGTGVGAALLLPPILLELTKRSDDGDRGTAMALYSLSFSAAVGVGSLAAAPLVAEAGFGTALILSTIACLVAAPIVMMSVGTRADH
ncbi:MAG: MFS transporter [Candidatus Dormibacteraeota bacterium]|nr:MFS transporter [Candidatus Dormibacteraeota bacterium]